MSILSITILLFGSMLFFLALGLPVVFVLGGLATVFILLLWGPQGLALVATKASGIMSNSVLLAVPLFILMAGILERSGVAEDMYNVMYRWTGALRGGLAAGTVGICTVIAAMSGVAATGTVTMGLIALPSMLKRKYDKRMAMGCIMAGGALGPLIPPSVHFIVYGSISGLSVGRLFLGGVFPGLLLSILFITYILVRCWLNPSLAPAIPLGEGGNWRQKFTALRGVILPLFLVMAVLGSIFLGLATPTEASAVGAFGSIVCAVVHRRLDWHLLRYAAVMTMKMSGMIMWILFAASLFAAVYQGLGAQKFAEDLLGMVPFGKWGMLIGFQVIFFILGCLMNTLSVLMITYPVFLPLIPILGFDPLWFAVLFMVNAEMGYLTPPFGTNLFYMKGIAPSGTPIEEIYRAIIPFVALQAIALVLIILFPPICTWLPSLWR